MGVEGTLAPPAQKVPARVEEWREERYSARLCLGSGHFTTAEERSVPQLHAL